MQPNDQIGVAILGCGYWGVNYVRVFNDLPQARVQVVCDQRPARLAELERRFPGVALTTDLDHALAMDGVDAVVICTPAMTHFDVARRCLDARKHVLVEKPITTTVADADELIELADSVGMTLMVGHTFIYNPAVRRVKEIIAQTQLGRVYYLYASRTNLGPIRQDVNALWDLSPHDISIFNYLLNRVPSWVSAVGVKVLRNGREDVGFVSLGYSDDIVGNIHVSWADPNKVREVVVVGSEKRVVFNDLNMMEPVRIYDKGVSPVAAGAADYGEYPYLMREGDITSPRIEFSEPLKNQCSHFIDCVREGTAPLTGGREGRDIVRVMEAIDRSIKFQGAPIEVEPERMTIQPNVERSNGRVFDPSYVVDGASASTL